MNATLVPKGELLDTKFALKDMALAAGLGVAPALYVMPESSTNAFVFAARRRRAVVGITEGFTRKLTIDQQRAVFANLVARLASGDTIVSTGVTALMWPVHAWRQSRMTADDTAQAAETAEAMQMGTAGQGTSSDAAGGFLLYIFFGIGFALLAELVAAGHRRALLSTAEKADAEGMLLLKDPIAMVSALKHCIELNNVVPAAGEAFAELFYCWTGISSDDEDDPEWIRVSRLREVIGVMGYEPDVIDERVEPPVAPRLEP
jgi:Zn-dependent protease with chaperone function